MRRRAFVKACALGAGCAGLGPALLLGGTDLRPHHYERVRLVDERGEPLRAANLQPRRGYVFHYPFAATPAFLLDMDRAVPPRNGLRTEDGDTYSYGGGVGPRGSVVAYSAICAHKLAHPTPAISYIHFRHARSREEPAFGVISCCAENSSYDPYNGARVVGGPARQPLAAILLEHDPEDDGLHAVGTLGGELFDRFFTEFEARFSLEYPDGEHQARVTDSATVMPLERFSDNVMRC